MGPDAIVLRIPLAGGVARAYRYPALDSVVWTTRATLPAQSQPLGFNSDQGVLALTDGAGVPWRLTLGSGALERANAAALAQPASIDGSGIFGTRGTSVLRLTTTEATPWQVATTAQLQQLQPLRDGGVLLIAQRGAQTVLSRYRPPETAAKDSTMFDGAARLISAAGSDRYYLSEGPRSLRSVRARDLEPLGTIALRDSLLATASSPSGDRVFVLGRDGTIDRLQVINKYADEIVAKIDMPNSSSALRMDPLGRYVLVRYGPSADSVLVVSVATNAVVGRLASVWRADLPLVFPDGRLATVRGDDVVVLSAEEFRALSVIAGGAQDLWTVVQWNGFRRRAGDAPLRATVARADSSPRTPPSADTAAAPRDTAKASALVAADTARLAARTADSTRGAPGRADTLRRAALRTDSVRRAALARADTVRRTTARDSGGRGRAARSDSSARTRAAPEPPATVGSRGTFLVQFAALKAEAPARELAGAIRANGERARVVSTLSNGITLYRVILGPFPSRADAERAGQAAGRDYWVFEGGSI
jgi:cell division septation protein DedD